MAISRIDKTCKCFFIKNLLCLRGVSLSESRIFADDADCADFKRLSQHSRIYLDWVQIITKHSLERLHCPQLSITTRPSGKSSNNPRFRQPTDKPPRHRKLENRSCKEDLSGKQDLEKQKAGRNNRHRTKAECAKKKPATRHSVQDETRAGITKTA